MKIFVHIIMSYRNVADGLHMIALIFNGRCIV